MICLNSPLWVEYIHHKIVSLDEFCVRHHHQAIGLAQVGLILRFYHWVQQCNSDKLTIYMDIISFIRSWSPDKLGNYQIWWMDRGSLTKSITNIQVLHRDTFWLILLMAKSFYNEAIWLRIFVQEDNRFFKGTFYIFFLLLSLAIDTVYHVIHFYPAHTHSINSLFAQKKKTILSWVKHALIFMKLDAEKFIAVPVTTVHRINRPHRECRLH